MAKRSKEKPPRLSTILQLLAGSDEERILISRLVEAFADRAFGALMFIFALPNVIPMPPGTSAILGFPLVVIAAQLA
ncbi:MAG: exopolysaccharide biosynthesis protein, partial [Rhizobiales bacterium]|nr:exopolysaccharide biosynthesis protein [Hyphomicrobiales bacterium]